MRLLSVRSLQLEQFNDEDVYPRYAILSHTWGEEEVTLPDLQREDVAQMKGYIKIQKSCECARMDGLGYIWIDTCCIDKSSSAELSEAINSMFNWYERSARCYAYLEDVQKPRDAVDDAEHREVLSSRLKKSRYWTRGWTLQELIAPGEVWFFYESWEFIGTRKDLSSDIAKITTIDKDVLTRTKFDVRSELELKSIAQRMSWVANRKTTRKEDLAYCLLGIFDINMPLLYGEGIQKAFRRLQEGIMRTSTDQTILAWNTMSYDETGALAPHPKNFASCGDLVAVPDLERASELTNLGLRINVRMVETRHINEIYAILACRHQDDFFRLVALPLCRQARSLRAGSSGSFERNPLAPLFPWPIINTDIQKPTFQTVYLSTTPMSNVTWNPFHWSQPQHVLLVGWPKDTSIIALPAERWNSTSRTMNFRDPGASDVSGAFAITITPVNAQPVTFGLGFSNDEVSNVQLFSEVPFSQPGDNVQTWLDHIKSQTAGGESNSVWDRLTVRGRVLEVVIKRRCMMGKVVFVIEPVRGGDDLAGSDPMFCSDQSIFGLQTN